VRFSTILSILLLLSACGPAGEKSSSRDAREKLDKNLQPRKVRLIRAEVRETNPSLEVVGEIRPFDEVDISSEVAGRVDQVRAEVGDRVKEGHMLVRLEAKTFELSVRQADAGLAAAKASLDLTERELERKKDLVSDHTIPQASFDQARARFDLASAELEEAKANLEMAQHRLRVTRIKAPSAGSITRRSVAVGQWIDVGQTIFRMATGSRIKIVARVPSAWAENLQGMENFEYRIGNSKELLKAKLFSIDPVINENSRSFEVIGTTKAKGIKAGAFARVILKSQRTEKSLWLPTEAVVISDTPRVLLADDSRVSFRRVQTGLRSENMVEIRSGLREDEEVISNVAGLSRDLPVEVLN